VRLRVAQAREQRLRVRILAFDQRRIHFQAHLLTKPALALFDEQRRKPDPAVFGVYSEAVDPAFAAIVGEQDYRDQPIPVSQADKALAAARHLAGERVRGIAAIRTDGQAGALPERQDGGVVVKSQVNQGYGRLLAQVALRSVRRTQVKRMNRVQLR